MKESSIEEKAKRYDEVVAMVKECIAYVPDKAVNEYMFNMFPELEESEDEKMWKLIKKYAHYNISDLALEADHITREHLESWLEKQCKNDSQVILPQFTFDDILALQCCMETVKKVQEDKDLYEKLKDLHDRMYDAYQLEKQNDNADKFEPKFKVGDFIANDYCRGKVVELTNDAYLLDTGQGIPFSCEHNVHLWTIQDAKDGDVLYSLDSCQPFIYKGRKSHEQATAYCGINKYDRLYNRT